MKKFTDLGDAHAIALERSKDKPYTEDDFLGFYHEHCMENASIVFLEEKGCELYGKSLEEIKNSGAELLPEIIHPDEIEQNVKLLLDFAAQRDESKTINYFQRFRSATSSIYNTYLTTASLDLSRNVVKCVTTVVSQMDQFRYQIGAHLSELPYVEEHKVVFSGVVKP